MPRQVTRVTGARDRVEVENSPGVVVYYCRTYVKAVRGRRVKRGDVCYGMLRAAACVDESDHHALMYVWHGQTVREDRVGEASARRPRALAYTIAY